MKIPEWIRPFLRGMGSVLDICPSQPSYEEQFGTDEELLELDCKLIQQDMDKAFEQLLEDARKEP